MQNVSYLLLCATLLGGLTVPTMAESTKPRQAEYHPEKRIEALKKNLSLSDEQVAQIKDILGQPTANNSMKPDERRTKFKAVETKIVAILTPEQKIKYDLFKTELKTKTKAEFHAKAMGRIKKELNLTDDQSEKVSKVLSTYQDDLMNVVKSDPNLSESKAQFTAAKNRRNEALGTILTADQMTQFKKIKKHDATHPAPVDKDPTIPISRDGRIGRYLFHHR